MDANGEVPLGGAACFGNPETALLLLEASADVETPMSDGATPLVIASQILTILEYICWYLFLKGAIMK